MSNKLIIIGYADAAGRTEGKIIAGPGLTTNDQAEAIMEAARDRHEFPEGLARVELYPVDQPAEIHQFIDAEAAKFVQGNFQQKLRLQEEQAAREEAQRASQKNFTAAHNVFQAAAKARNEAVGALAVQTNLLAADLDAKGKAAVQAKVEKLQPLADAAVSAFQQVLAQFDIVRNPKSKPEDVTAALIALGVVKAPASEK